MSSRTEPVLKRKRSSPAVHGGVIESFHNIDNSFCCPICFHMLDEPYMTKCGHSFCYKCILHSLEIDSRCPKCGFIIDRKEEIFPNFLLAEMISKRKLKLDEGKKLKMSNDTTTQLDLDNMDLDKVNDLITTLYDRKQRLQYHRDQDNMVLLKEFLGRALDKKKKEIDVLTEEADMLKEDLLVLEKTDLSQSSSFSSSSAVVPLYPSSSSSSSTLSPSLKNEMMMSGGCSGEMASNDEGFNSYSNKCKSMLDNMSTKRKKLDQHFEDLLQVYFNKKKKTFDVDVVDQDSSSTSSSSSPPTKTATRTISPTTNSQQQQQSSSAQTSTTTTTTTTTPTMLATKRVSSLQEFSTNLNKFVQFSTIRVLSSLNYHTDICNANSIVSSIEFDKDCEYFAIAGVTKKIKIFEYSSVIKYQIDIHYPVTEVLCASKISSVTWNTYHKNLLASSDYDGTVCLWDAGVAGRIRVFQEHEKRCWSVDFNRIDPCLLASGSDDAKVKLWHTNTDHSIASLQVRANVCGVKFNPASLYHLAFGSADHRIHYYDLRQMKEPMFVLKGHKKAVSYAKFINHNQIVSASTDSQLKLWDVETRTCTQTFLGHTNERNFVGLATDRDYVACGSENNSIYIYYKNVPRAMLSYKFEPLKSVLMNDKPEEESTEFVSAVCWKAGSNVILAANSQGNIKVLEMTP